MKYSILDCLEAEGLTKDFFNHIFENKVLDIIRNINIDFTKPLSMNEFVSLLSYKEDGVDTKYYEKKYKEDDLFEDDVFCFIAQEKLVELSEDENSNENDMYEIKKFLTYHTMYQEAMVDSAYDKILRKKGEAPEHVIKQYPTTDEDEYWIEESNATSMLEQSEEPAVKHFTDSFDKYKNAEFKIPKKNFKKADFYKGCKVVIEGSPISSIIYIDKWDDTKVYSDIGMDFDAKKAVPIFQTLEPEIGDIALINSNYYIIGTKEMLKSCKENSNTSNITFYTIKYNNRKIEKLKVKRFSCGTLDKDISGVPYHVEIEYEDIHLSYDIDMISKHYNISHDKLHNKEVSLMKQLKIALDHPLNVKRSEWALLVAKAGAGKTTLAVQYAEEKKLDYVIMQGNAQLSQDDFIGYKSIIKNDKDMTVEDLYVRSLLRDCVEYGKVFILDEIDACNPNTLICLNSLKNKQFQFPDKLVDVHPNFRFIATANTLEYDDVYNARSKLDKATLDRFKIIESDLEDHHLALRYGFKYVKNIKNIDRLTPREVERLVTEAMIEEETEN